MEPGGGDVGVVSSVHCWVLLSSVEDVSWAHSCDEWVWPQDAEEDGLGGGETPWEDRGGAYGTHYIGRQGRPTRYE